MTTQPTDPRIETGPAGDSIAVLEASRDAAVEAKERATTRRAELEEQLADRSARVLSAETEAASLQDRLLQAEPDSKAFLASVRRRAELDVTLSALRAQVDTRKVELAAIDLVQLERDVQIAELRIVHERLRKGSERLSAVVAEHIQAVISEMKPWREDLAKLLGQVGDLNFPTYMFSDFRDLKPWANAPARRDEQGNVVVPTAADMTDAEENALWLTLRAAFADQLAPERHARGVEQDLASRNAKLDAFIEAHGGQGRPPVPSPPTYQPVDHGLDGPERRA
jgi:CHAD domain-containing protein